MFYKLTNGRCWTGHYDGTSLKIFINGVLEGQTPYTQGIFPGTDNLGIGAIIGGNPSYQFPGRVDETSIYNRALSASEIQAIYNNSVFGNVQGGNGKFDPNEFPLSARQSLAEAQISVNGGAPTMLLGDNTWQSYTVSFKATQTSTPLQIQGIEPGMLLDAASVTAVVTNYSYLVFTENTNLTTTPIKFAIPPFSESGTNFVVWQNGFADTNSSQVPPWIYTPAAGTYFAGGWYVVSGTIDDIYRNYQGGLTLYGGENYCLDIDGNNPGWISTNLATVPGQTYILSFAYTKNPSAATTPHAAVFLGGAQLGTLAPNIANSWSV